MSADDPTAAARAAYDAGAAAYADQVGTTMSDQFERWLDRAFLDEFAQRMTGTSGVVVDVGCGTGRVTALLGERGIDVVGLDVSAGMLAEARSAHPRLRFGQAVLDHLPLHDGSAVGVAAWYSIIHTPPDGLAAVFAELARVLAADGHLLVGFQSGDGEAVVRENPFEQDFGLATYRHEPALVVDHLTSNGFLVDARAERQPAPAQESTRQILRSAQAFVLAQRTGSR